MAIQILNDLTIEIKALYDFIPYANWDSSKKGSRPAPYKLKQTYPEDHPYWEQAEPDRVGIRLNNLVFVDYDGNKPEAVGKIPTVDELAIVLGYTSSQELFDSALIQWNDESTSLHFLFVAPPEFNITDFKQSNQGTTEHFWKYIDIKTGNQLVYLKQGKHVRLMGPTQYSQAPQIVIEQLRSKITKTLLTDFDSTIICTDHQVKFAEEWLHEAVIEMSNTPDGSRNGTLNILGCTVAGLIAGGALDNQASYTLLYEAAIRAGSEQAEIINTLASAWEEGFNTPRRDAPYVKQNKPISEVFADRIVHNTNIDTKQDRELTDAIQEGNIDSQDPNAGILHQQYTYFKENWVMSKEGRYIEINNLFELGKSAFNAMHSKNMPVKLGSKAFKKFIPSDVFDNCNPTVVSSTMYNPSVGRLFDYECIPYLNSYIEYSPERPTEVKMTRMLNLILNHLDWLFDDPTHQRYILDWMAWQVQSTGRLVGWCPLIMGCRGDGKSILFELVTGAIGPRNTKMMGNKSAKSDFQDWAIGAAVTAFEEIKAEGKESRQIANDMKQFITEKRVNINPKGTKEDIHANFTNYIAFSNESDPLAIAPQDRRWFTLETKHFGKNTVTHRTQTDMKQHFDDIKDAVNHNEHYPTIHWVLRDHAISEEFINHRFRAPDTIFGHELNAQTNTEKENRLQEYLDNARFVDGRIGLIIECEDGFQIQDFRSTMPDNWFQHMEKPSSIVLGKWLRNLGYEQRPRMAAHGKQYKTFKRIKIY